MSNSLSSATITVIALESNSVLHHFRVPRKREEQDKNEKTSADENLSETQDGDESVKKSFPPKPIGNHAADRDRFEDSQRQVNDVGIVKLVPVRQPPAGNEMSINGRGGDRMNDRN